MKKYTIEELKDSGTYVMCTGADAIKLCTVFNIPTHKTKPNGAGNYYRYNKNEKDWETKMSNASCDRVINFDQVIFDEENEINVNDWNIECKTIEEFVSVCSYINKIYPDEFRSVVNLWNTGNRFVRFNRNRRALTNCSDRRTTSYPKLKSITFDEFLTMHSSTMQKQISEFNHDDWNIECKTIEEFMDVCQYIESIHESFTTYKKHTRLDDVRHVRFNRHDRANCSYHFERTSKYPESKSITYQQFLTLKEVRIIIAHKAPFDMYNGKIKTGDVLVEQYTIDSRYHNITQKITDINLPSEFVNTWEPVYDEEFKIGEWFTILPDTGIEYRNIPGSGKTFQIINIGNMNGTGIIRVYFRFLNDELSISGRFIRKATEDEIWEADRMYLDGDNKYLIEFHKGFIKINGITYTRTDLERTFALLNCHQFSYITIVIDDKEFRLDVHDIEKIMNKLVKYQK